MTDNTSVIILIQPLSLLQAIYASAYSEAVILVVLPDFHTAYLTADGLGKFVNELYDTGVFVRSGHFLYVVLQLLDQFLAGAVLIVFGQYDGGFHHLSPYFIGNSGDGTFYNCGMRHQALSTSNGPMR